MPPEMSIGFSASLDYGNTIVRLPGSGGQEKVRNQEMPVRTWTATKGLFSVTRVEEFLGFMGARFGALYGFRFWDAMDFSTHPTQRRGTPAGSDQFLGSADGTQTRFPIRRTYPSTAADLAQRLAIEDRMLPIINEVDDRLASKIGLPNGTTFDPVVMDNGTPVTWTFDWVTREFITTVAPTVGHTMTWGGYYDWPAQFTEETDRALDTIAESWDSRDIPSIGIEMVPFDRFAPETDDPGGLKTLTWSVGVPLITKVEAKNWILAPATPLSVQLEDVNRHYAGGPHLVLINSSANAVTVKDAVTGNTLFTLGVTGSAADVARLFVQELAGVKNWVWILS